MELIKFILGLFTGSAGSAVGGAVSTGVQVAAVIAALGTLGAWFTTNHNEVVITLTYGDLLFWGSLAIMNTFIIVRLVHRAAPPQ